MILDVELLSSILSFENLHTNVFIDIALLVTIGIIGGKIAEFFHLPRVTGYIIIGMLFGPNVLNVFNSEMIYDLKALKILGLGFIGYNVGLEVNFKMLKYNRNAVLFITIFQAIVTFVLVGGMILIFVDEYAWTYALIFGAIATVTTPAPIVACIRSYHTKGRLTALLCPMIALDDVLGVILFAFVLPISVYLAGHTGQALTVGILVGEPLLQIIISIGVGLAIGLIVEKFIEYFYKGDKITIFLIIVVGLLFGIGITYMFDLSTILLPLTIGAILSNRLNFELRDKVRGISDSFILPILLIFFTLSGAELNITLLSTLEVIGIIYIFIRVVGKLVGAFTGSVIMREETKVKKYLGLALIPQGGVAIDMAILAEIRFIELSRSTGNTDYAIIGSTVLAVILAAVLIYKVFGEIIVKWAFRQANEITEEDHTPHAHLL
ncbi:Sodium/hydrogen exchanger family protein [Candidatus Izimaplasma bacterium HR1]|jgi:Kef-type K+ transport system membrane component KefB|uniref:cation:proton antiporter n=1 Tax=Candidatus Izimoplasma sp. HR1 TaxID=1541959 RepID=UPI0004F89FAE|nr:Sodium/hydrogen exchanger family protein [Candidatus Izimaplasma bacterium HR1]